MLTQVLSEKYALSNVILTPAPRGFVAETYYVSSDSDRYFAKIVELSRHSEAILRSLPLLLELRQLGVEPITYPIQTVDRQYAVPLERAVLVLFNYIDASQTDDFPVEPYVQILGHVHQQSQQIQTSLPHETFDVPYKADLRMYLDRLTTGKFNNPYDKTLQDWVWARRGEIMRDLAILETTVTQLHSSEHSFILTHGDAIGNVLYNGQNLYIADWDTAMFAPRERDTWFHRHTAGFLPLYREFVPGYDFDVMTCRFYLYNRYFEDMLGFVEKILAPNSTDPQKAHNLNELYKTCDGWLRPLMEVDRTGL